MDPPHRRAECLRGLGSHQPQLKAREYSSRHRRQDKKQICPHLAPSAPYEQMDQCQGEIDRREYWPNSGDPAHSVLTGSTVRSSLNLERPVAVLRTLFSPGRLVTCLFSTIRSGNRTGMYWYPAHPWERLPRGLRRAVPACPVLVAETGRSAKSPRLGRAGSLKLVGNLV